MTERWRERAPTSAAEAYHDLRVADSLAEEMRAAGEAGYMDAAYLRASQAENGESGTVEDGKAWWRYIPTSHKFRHLAKAKELHEAD